MVELSTGGDELVFRFPDVHEDAALRVSFKRTLRIPDDGKQYPLPPGLGNFPLRHVDDFLSTVPGAWKMDGGVMMPMYQAEAMWVTFSSSDVDNRGQYPFAIKIATGKVNAVSGQPMRKGLNMEPQDYVVAPLQPWLDGYCVEKGTVRQFVAMPLGQGFSVEEQVTGRSEFGGLQILVYPMKRKAFERRFHKPLPYLENCSYSCEMAPDFAQSGMGLSPGGTMNQEIYDDPYSLEEWDLENYSHCFVHIANSEIWTAITGKMPPYSPLTVEEYSMYGLPWFNYYAAEDATAIEGAEKLKGLKSVKEMGGLKKRGYTHITVILDRSGSMESIREDTIGGLNAFVEQQKAGPGEATLTLVQFDSQAPYEVIRNFTPITDVPPLTAQTYVPRGTTPLLDALGRGINDIEERIGRLREEERPEKVVVAVVTDGQENSSREFTKERVEKMIRNKSSDEGWEFIFLSADLDAIDEAVRLGFRQDSTVPFEKSPSGVACCMDSLSERVFASRSGLKRT